MKKLLLALVLCVLVSSQAFASVYVWQDEKYDFTVVFPDSWIMQTADTPSIRLRISGPINEDKATCHVRAMDDGRLQIYPKNLMTTAVEQKMNLDFWKDEILIHKGGKDGVVHEYFAPSNMGGRGDATAIRYSYTDVAGHKMYGTMVGSIHADKGYIAGCTSRLERFDRYATLFTNIIESVQLEQKYYPFATGYYRDFLADNTVEILNDKPGNRGKENDTFIDTITGARFFLGAAKLLSFF